MNVPGLTRENVASHLQVCIILYNIINNYEEEVCYDVNSRKALWFFFPSFGMHFEKNIFPV